MLTQKDSQRSALVVKSVARKADGNALEFVMSDATPDRMGDVIEPAGWNLANFQKNPIALFGHDTKFIVGNWRNVRVVKGELRGTLDLMAPVSERQREVAAAVEAGVLRAVSVGFRALKAEPVDEDEPFAGTRFLEQELVEVSLVAVGANPNALQIAKSLNLSPETVDLIFGKLAAKDQSARDGITGKLAEKTTPNRKTSSMSLSERVVQSEQAVIAAKDALTNHMTKVGDDNISEADFEITQELSRKVADAERTRDARKMAEQHMAIKSDIVVAKTSNESDRRPFAVAKKSIRPGDYWFRAAVCTALARVQQRNADEVRRERYGDDEPTKLIFDLVTKASTVPATTTLTGWAAELVTTVNVDVIDQLIPNSAYAPLSNFGPKFSFGQAGIVSIPARSATPTLAGAFVAQGAAIPVKQAAFTAATLTPKKMGVITVLTRDIAEHSTPSIEAIVRQAMQDDTSVAIDTVLLDATAKDTTRPAGLRNGVSATTATAGGGFNALVGDIKALVGVLVAANSLRSPVFIMNPAQVLSISMTQNAGGDFPFAAEVNGGRLRGYPIIQSTSVTAGMVILLDAADFFSATGDTPRFDVSDQAVIHMEDTTPLAIGTTGSPNVVAAPTRSLWQTDCIGIRMILDINWAMRRTGVLAWTQAVTW